MTKAKTVKTTAPPLARLPPPNDAFLEQDAFYAHVEASFGAEVTAACSKLETAWDRLPDSYRETAPEYRTIILRTLIRQLLQATPDEENPCSALLIECIEQADRALNHPSPAVGASFFSRAQSALGALRKPKQLQRAEAVARIDKLAATPFTHGLEAWLSMGHFGAGAMQPNAEYVEFFTAEMRDLRKELRAVEAGEKLKPQRSVRLTVARIATAYGWLAFQQCDPSEGREFTRLAAKARDALLEQRPKARKRRTCPE